MNTWPYAGSRWWKFEFHCHTPASDDYPKNDLALRSTITPRQWLDGYVTKGFDAVIITDHNTGAWIDRLVAERDRMLVENPAAKIPIIFPGVELGIETGHHILLVLPPGAEGTQRIGILLGACGYSGPLAVPGAANGRGTMPLAAVVDAARQHGALVIPAHANDTHGNGIWHHPDHNSLIRTLEHRDLFAWEIVDGGIAATPAVQSVLAKKNFTAVRGSDCHTLLDTDIGRCWTWIKMTDPMVAGLRLALLDGAASVRIGVTGERNRNEECAEFFIESVTVKNTRHMGRVRAFEVRFSPWMTTVIGSRGTGKSSLVEFVRHALNRGEELPTDLKTEFRERYAGDDGGRGSKGLLLPNAECEIIFQKNATRLRVRYMRENNQRIVEQQGAAGEWAVAPGTTENFRVRIYSQRQIFQLARDPARFLEEIDRSPEVGRDAWKIEWDQAVHRYKSASAQLRAERLKLAEEATSKGELADVIRWLNLREEAGNKEVLQRYQKTQVQLAELKNWSAGVDNLAAILDKAAADVGLPAFDATRFQDVADTEAVSAATALVRKLTGISEAISGLKVSAAEVGEEWKQFLATSTWATQVKIAEDAYRVLAGQLGAGGANDALEYEAKLKSRQALEDKQKQFDAIRLEITRLETELGAAGQALSDHREALTSRRKSFLETALAGLTDLTIEIVPFGNHEDAIDDFTKLVRKPEMREHLLRFEPLPIGGLFGALYVGKYQPATDFLAKLASLRAKVAGIQAGDVSAAAGVSALPLRWLKALTPEDIDAVQTWYPKDSVRVKYRARPGDSLKPLEQGSPGQQTAALLLFLMSYGTEPLLLDQPEDDLDNRMIYEALTRQFSDLKRRRQLIIVTHNANIVVNGDSELVVCLESENGQTISTNGGLQEESVRRVICEVMEGGETAFDLRYRRIREDLISI